MSTGRRGHIKKRKLRRDPKQHRWDATGRKSYRRKRGFRSPAEAETGLAAMIAEIDAGSPAPTGSLAAYRWTLAKYLTRPSGTSRSQPQARGSHQALRRAPFRAEECEEPAWSG